MKIPHVPPLMLAALAAASLACGGAANLLGGNPTPTPVPQPQPTATQPQAVLPTATPRPSGISSSNAASLTQLRVINVENSSLLASASAPQGSTIATFGFDKMVRLYDSQSGELLDELRGHVDYGYGLAFSPDGRYLASGAGFRIHIWDAATGALLTEIPVNAVVFRVVWSPDSSAVAAVGDGSSRIFVFDPQTGTQIDELRSPDGLILWAVTYSPDGSLLAVSDANGKLSVIEAATGVIVHEDTTPRGPGWDLEFSPDGSLLSSVNGGGGVYIWETSTWEIVLSGENIHPGGATDGTFSKDSSVFFSVGDDGYLNAYDTNAGGDPLASIYFAGAGAAWTVSQTGDGQRVIVSMDDGTLQVVGLR